MSYDAPNGLDILATTAITRRRPHPAAEDNEPEMKRGRTTPAPHTALPALIAQGSYGCAFAPSLTCAPGEDGASAPPEFYHNKISKLMAKRNADKELGEYGAISMADPDQNFFLGVPTQCAPATDYVEYSGSCAALKKFREGDTPSLIIMENGGPDITHYCADLLKRANQMSETAASAGTPLTRAVAIDHFRTEIEWFILAMYKLAWGLKLLLKNDLMHSDIKPGNIVYNTATHDMKFIDFGMMGKLSDFKNGDLSKPCYWWSSPWEFDYIRSGKFKALLELVFKPTEINGAPNPEVTDLYVKTDDQHDVFFSIVFNMKNFKERQHLLNHFYMPYLKKFYDNIAHTVVKYRIDLNALNDTHNGKNQSKIKTLYYKLFGESYERYDLYGYGITFMHFLSRARWLIDPTLFEKLNLLVLGMITPNLFERLSVDDMLLSFRRDIIEPFGLFDKHPEFLTTYGHIFNVDEDAAIVAAETVGGSGNHGRRTSLRSCRHRHFNTRRRRRRQRRQ